MKRFIATSLIVGVCSAFGLMGCADESKIKEEKTISTPDGESKVTTETKVESSGSNPPPAATTTDPVTAPVK